MMSRCSTVAGCDGTGGRGVVAATSLYLVIEAALPILNQRIFRAFPYPLTVTALHISFIAVVLALANAASHLLWGEPTHSWIGDRHLLTKVRIMAPAGLLFGVKGGVTNWGLALVPTATHNLLQSTEFCFGCAAAWALNGERPSGVGLAAAAGAFAGGLLVSSTLFDFDAAPVDARRADAAFALALNLAPPLIGALTISTLRGGAARLLGKPSPVADGVSVVEVTSLMMLLSTSVAAPIALAVEELGALGGNATVVDAIEGGALPAARVYGVAVLLVALHLAVTWIAHATSAFSLLILNNVKVVPMWAAATVWDRSGGGGSGVRLAGAALCLASSVGWACAEARRAERRVVRRILF